MEVLIIWLAIIFGFGFLRMFLRKRFGIAEEERTGIQEEGSSAGTVG